MTTERDLDQFVLAFLVTLTLDMIHNLRRLVRWYRSRK
jgi:hypothetical protein